MDKLTAFKLTHDEIFERMTDSEKAEHLGSGSCGLCVESETAALNEGGEPVSKTYSEEEVKALVKNAVDEATAPLEAQLAEVETSKAQEEFDAKIATLEAEHAQAIDTLKAELDTAKVEAGANEQKFNDVIAYLESEKAAADEAAAIEARKEERLAAVKEVASFDEAYLEENIDRWASLSEEDFGALTASWDAVKATVKPVGGEELPSGLPAESAMHNGGGESGKAVPAYKEIIGLRSRGIDARTLVA